MIEIKISKEEAKLILKEWDNISINKCQQTLSQKHTAVFPSKYPGINRFIKYLGALI